MERDRSSKEKLKKYCEDLSFTLLTAITKTLGVFFEMLPRGMETIY